MTPLPPSSLAVIGAGLLEDGHDVKLFDFNLPENNLSAFQHFIEEYGPDFAGITFVTPLFEEMKKILTPLKKTNPRIITIGGGPHGSSFPGNTLEESELDIVVWGEGDFIIRDVVNGKELKTIRGIAYRNKGTIVVNERAEPIDPLDDLPMPAYQLYNMKRYCVEKTIAKHSPVAWMETSRGCLYGCVYCNKSIFGQTFRAKSPKRVVDEMERAKKMGFKEIHFTDDAFTTDMDRANTLCDEMIGRDLRIAWCPITGIRVNQADYELLKKMQKAGCYRVVFGIESGNQQILNTIKKGITIEQIVQATHSAKKAGLEVWGAFMIGLPGETEETMQQTIDLAKRLPLDLVKMSILIPLPATPLFEEWDRKGIIKTKEWNKFSFYSVPETLYDHPNLPWETIMRYYDTFYRSFYFRPSFMWRRLKSSMKKGMIIEDMRVFLGTEWFQKSYN